jgi:hypothetical protein
LCQPRVIVKMIGEKQMECRLAGEKPKFSEKTCPSATFVHHHFCPSQNPTWPEPGLNPGRRGGKPATNRLIYGAAPREWTNTLQFVGKDVKRSGYCLEWQKKTMKIPTSIADFWAEMQLFVKITVI